MCIEWHFLMYSCVWQLLLNEHDDDDDDDDDDVFLLFFRATNLMLTLLIGLQILTIN